jgi:hypothetical protein
VRGPASCAGLNDTAGLKSGHNRAGTAVTDGGKVDTMKTIYEAIKEKGIEYDTHESDLYLPATEEVSNLLAEYHAEFLSNVTRFRNQINGQIWFDVPFANDLWWQNCIDSQRQKDV